MSYNKVNQLAIHLFELGEWTNSQLQDIEYWWEISFVNCQRKTSYIAAQYVGIEANALKMSRLSRDRLRRPPPYRSECITLSNCPLCLNHTQFTNWPFIFLAIIDDRCLLVWCGCDLVRIHLMWFYAGLVRLEWVCLGVVLCVCDLCAICSGCFWCYFIQVKLGWNGCGLVWFEMVWCDLYFWKWSMFFDVIRGWFGPQSFWRDFIQVWLGWNGLGFIFIFGDNQRSLYDLCVIWTRIMLCHFIRYG